VLHPVIKQRLLGALFGRYRTQSFCDSDSCYLKWKVREIKSHVLLCVLSYRHVLGRGNGKDILQGFSMWSAFEARLHIF